jgi:hypothetical protein
MALNHARLPFPPSGQSNAKVKTFIELLKKTCDKKQKHVFLKKKINKK